MLDVQLTAAQGTKATETVICRLAGEVRGFFGAAVVLAVLFPLGITAGALTSPGFFWSDAFLLLLLGTVCIVPLGLACAICLAKSCIIADKYGVRWRKAGRWRSAVWEDVTATFQTTRSSNSSRNSSFVTIKAPSGTLVIYGGYWSSETEIWQIIKGHAGQVSGLSRSGAIVVRSPLLPLHCRYDTPVNRNILGWMDTLHRGGLAAVVIYFALQWWTTHTLPGWGWLLTPTGLFVICKQTLPLLLRPLYRATQQRLGDRISADEEGLRFFTAQGETAFRWEDITNFYMAGDRYVLVTASGEHDFLDTLTNAQWLKIVIPRRAVNAEPSHWRQTGWRSGTVQRRQVTLPNGDQSVQCRYHYRSLANCGQLWGLSLAVFFLAGMTLGPALIAAQSGLTISTRELIAAVIGLVGVGALLWLWASYWLCGIRMDEEGLTQTTLLGTRRMAWRQVHGFCWRGSADLAWGCVEGMNATIRFWKGIGDAEQLADEIAAHGVTVRQ